MFEVALIFVLALGLAWPLGLYMAGVFSGEPHVSDRLFGPLERITYRLIGVNPLQGMTWKTYVWALLFCNLVLGGVAYLILLFQHLLPMNPDNIGPLSWDLALHTAVSFLTNTNQQHYSGQAQLSYLSQGFLIVTLQVVTPMTGLAACVAILRGMFGGRNADSAKEGEPRDLGNFYVDLVRGVLRVALPVALVTSLLLTWQGVPSTYQGAQVAQPLDTAAEMREQVIPVGPVAPMVAIKQLGTNGGGWYGPNSSNPLENPTPVSNAIETVALVLIPMSIVFMTGFLLHRRRFAVMSLAVMGVMSIVLIAATVYSEVQPNAAFAGLSADGSNMEGKELRFGPELSALWGTFTTQTSNGSVNAMHDSFNPLGGLVTRAGMLINAIWGGVGVGFINFIVYVWIAVFLSGLMIGRTPEIFGRKIETREITALGALIVLPTFVILGLTAITVGVPGLAQNSNPGFHGISQVFYEYTSAFANNGSGFEGLGDDTPWWNLTCVLALLLGRYLPMVLPLMVAGWLASKRVTPASNSTLRLESVTFGATLIAVILILNFLSFLPSAVLGPIGEGLELSSPLVSQE
ncbi:potassium-transporting ATPase subunit KdpA [Halopseudomonas aestusnigri]|uniref:Potassium-transporting ATPase potassium-binding subunit n=1 Tax=Halopseudomonas aestusnigri TaxID=857252 RepID=A0AAQ1G9I7_9GAMM|nr:potassium-transporting ATPase subunit KdpA [Halopseudomonas aestusnigri]OWL85257.1 potassium-transporting ATPase subunit KdpA [Halopseudomonas aestusnigri]SEG67188.1 K+-transporting ATPase ATPase A chain [Halopseudomonas aestusnigri]